MFRSDSHTDRGARRSAVAAVLLSVAIVCGTAGSAPADDVPTPPGLSAALQPGLGAGDFEFYVDAACLRPASSGRTLVRVLVQLPLRAFLVQTKADRADVRLQARAFDAKSALDLIAAEDAAAARAANLPEDSLRAAYVRTDIALERLLTDFEGVRPVSEAELQNRVEAKRDELHDTDYQTFELALEVPPGDHVLEVVMQNLSRKKRGLLDRLRNRPLAAGLRILVRVPNLAQPPMLADPVFEIGHGSRAPYAARLYGLLNDSLHVRTRLFGHGNYQVRLAAVDRGGETAWQDSQQVVAAGERELTFESSVNALPAGQYLIQITAQGDSGLATTARSFDVAWSLVTWKTARRALDVEAELALDEASFAAYRDLPVGEKERFLEDWWRKLDPSTGTAQNEVHDEFRRRMAIADVNFTEGSRGSLSDRGRVFIHFGVPEELQVEAMPGHLAGRGAEEALEKVDDVFRATEQKRVDQWDRVGTTHGTSPWERVQKQQERNRIIGPAREVVGYELWIYKGGGSPLFPADRALTLDTGLRLLFVDMSGFGEYRLRKASAPLPIHGLSADF